MSGAPETEYKEETSPSGSGFARFTWSSMRDTAKTANQTEAPACLPRTARVLVVDDSTTNQLVAAVILERLGCEVQFAANGAEALEFIAQEPFQVVFMDCMMPVMDGYEATEAIRRLPGSAGRTPIVAITAAAMPGDRERCLAAGMDDYLSKPVWPEQLEKALIRWTTP